MWGYRVPNHVALEKVCEWCAARNQKFQRWGSDILLQRMKEQYRVRGVTKEVASMSPPYQ
jgi:hypothetical protein